MAKMEWGSALKNTQEYPPKTILEKEVEMELQSSLKKPDLKGPNLDIVLYFGEHTTVNSGMELAEFCKKEGIDLLADEYVYTGDLNEMVDPVKDYPLIEKKEVMAKQVLDYEKTFTENATTPSFIHDITPGDFLRKKVIVGLIESDGIESEMCDQILKYSFEEFCEKMIKESDKYRNMQRTREGVVLQTLAEKTSRGIIEHDLVGREKLKTLVFFGFNHYQFYRNFAHIHPSFKIHFQDPYLNQWAIDNPSKTPPFALGMAAFNSIKNEEDQFITHEEYESDPYRYVAQELRLRLNNQAFHERREHLFKQGYIGEIYERVTKEIDNMAKEYKATEKESSYYQVAKALFTEYQQAVRG